MFWGKTPPKKVVVSGKLFDICQACRPVFSTLIFSWELHPDSNDPVFYCDTKENGEFEIELRPTKDDPFLFMKTAQPWTVCPTNEASLSWIRISMDPSTSKTKLNNEGNLESSLGVVNVLPSNIHRFLKKNGKNVAKLTSCPILTFLESENGSVEEILPQSNSSSANTLRIESARLKPVLKIMFPKRPKKSNV